MTSAMTSVVERIRALNPKLNAIVMDLTEQALAEAAAAERGLVSGMRPGPLFGVPGQQIAKQLLPVDWNVLCPKKSYCMP